MIQSDLRIAWLCHKPPYTHFTYFFSSGVLCRLSRMNLAQLVEISLIFRITGQPQEIA